MNPEETTRQLAAERRANEVLQARADQAEAEVRRLVADNRRLLSANGDLLVRYARAHDREVALTAELAEANEHVDRLTDLVRRLQEVDDAAGVAAVETLLGLPRTDDLMGLANSVGINPHHVQRDHQPRLTAVPRQGGAR